VSDDTRPVGAMLTCDQGEWSGSGTVTYQWLVDGEPVETGTQEGGTGSANPKRFRCGASLVGHTVTCAVTKTNRHGSTTVETNPVRVV
jgi:hypothetical protein